MTSFTSAFRCMLRLIFSISCIRRTMISNCFVDDFDVVRALFDNFRDQNDIYQASKVRSSGTNRQFGYPVRVERELRLPQQSRGISCCSYHSAPPRASSGGSRESTSASENPQSRYHRSIFVSSNTGSLECREERGSGGRYSSICCSTSLQTIDARLLSASKSTPPRRSIT